MYRPPTMCRASRLSDFGLPVLPSKTATPTGEVSTRASRSARACCSSPCLRALAMVAAAQTRRHAFEIAAGTMYGLQDLERPVAPGWVVSSGFDLGRQSFVVEGAWRGATWRLSLIHI